MGRRRQAAVLLSLLFAGIASAGIGDRFALRAARWAPPERRLHALAFEPTPCMKFDPEGARALMIGRVAFRTPNLLGGQAARAGLSCNSCHRGGRGNPDFQFEGLSGAPGTADVTSSFMSSHRGDGIDNPKPIPDLSGPPGKLKVSRDPRDGQLEAFIHGLITAEFDGPEPGKATLDGLARYVRALSPEGCPAAPAERRINLRLHLADIDVAIDAARAAFATRDRATARLMLAGARAALGQIHERYAAPGLEADRALLLAADRTMAAFQDAVDRGEPGLPARLEAWRRGMSRWSAPLARDERLSLFDPERLAASLKAP